MLNTLAISYVAASVLATVVLASSPHFDRAQKYFQAAAVWLLPVIGAAVILVFHSIVYRNMRTRLQPDRPNHNQDESLTDFKDLD